MNSRRQPRPWLRAGFFLLLGLGFYVYYGIEMNAWKQNLPNLLIYLVIVAGLFWAMTKKQQLQREREQDENQDKPQ